MEGEIDYNELVVKEYKYWTLKVHENQSYLGRCVIALNREGNLDPFLECAQEEQNELRSIVVELSEALKKLFHYDMMNYSNLRNVWHHCHWHIIPRYETSRTFEGMVFEDNQWGGNCYPTPKWKLDMEMLRKIRDALKQELGK